MSTPYTQEGQGKAKGAVVCTSLSDGLDIARETAIDDAIGEICVIGGAALFAATLPRAHRLYITEVDASPDGDVLFPDFDESAFHETLSERHSAGEKDDHDFTFRILERR